MALYIILSACFLLVLLFSVVDRRKISKEMKQLKQDLSALNGVQIRFELSKSEINDQTDLSLSLSSSTPGLLNSTQQAAYDEYQKNGGIDDIPTWLMKSEMNELFP